MTALLTARNWLAYRIFMVWPSHQNLPRWQFRVSLWLSTMAAEWAYRDEPRA